MDRHHVGSSGYIGSKSQGPHPVPLVVVRGQGSSRDLIIRRRDRIHTGADPRLWTPGEEDPAASAKIPTAGPAGRPPNDDDDGVWACHASRASRRLYAQATREPTKPRQSLRDRAASRLRAAAEDNDCAARRSPWKRRRSLRPSAQTSPLKGLNASACPGPGLSHSSNWSHARSPGFPAIGMPPFYFITKPSAKPRYSPRASLS